MTTNEKIKEALSVLPSEWSDKLYTLLCSILEDKSKPSCEDVRDCETVTSLSQFNVDGTQVSITYTDENSVSVTRSFDVEQILNSQLENIDPSCLTDSTSWQNLSYPEKIQLIITEHCDCCS